MNIYVPAFILILAREEHHTSNLDVSPAIISSVADSAMFQGVVEAYRGSMTDESVIMIWLPRLAFEKREELMGCLGGLKLVGKGIISKT